MTGYCHTSPSAARRDELDDEQDQDRNHPRPPLPTSGFLAILAAARRVQSWAGRGRLSSVAGPAVLNVHGDCRSTVDGRVSAVVPLLRRSADDELR